MRTPKKSAALMSATGRMTQNDEARWRLAERPKSAAFNNGVSPAAKRRRAGGLAERPLRRLAALRLRGF